MKNTTLTVAVVAGIIALGLAAYLSFGMQAFPVPSVIEEPVPEGIGYTSVPYALSFTYSPGYYLKERNAGTDERPQLSLVLVEDTEENRAVIDGRTTEPRDGPTAITIDVYPNPDRLPAEDWVRADTNWTIRTSEAAPVGRGSVTGVTYSWSGLYEGKSVVATKDDRAYVFSVTWLSPEDAILAEFERILSSARLGSE